MRSASKSCTTPPLWVTIRETVSTYTACIRATLSGDVVSYNRSKSSMQVWNATTQDLSLTPSFGCAIRFCGCGDGGGFFLFLCKKPRLCAGEERFPLNSLPPLELFWRWDVERREELDMEEAVSAEGGGGFLTFELPFGILLLFEPFCPLHHCRHLQSCHCPHRPRHRSHLTHSALPKSNFAASTACTRTYVLPLTICSKNRKIEFTID
mmetsp:Transcript_6724/g.25198  ORF Transcript_6724/g.25198 Transcript_6724/m.25198 type:complete len:209 (-) Transcript_6724:430-1056(-)